MDAEEVELVFKLFIEDAQNEIALSEANRLSEDFRDSEIAFSETLKVLRHQLQLLQDRRVACGLSRACREDVPAIEEALIAEEQAVRDHELALRFAGLRKRKRPIERQLARHNGSYRRGGSAVDIPDTDQFSEGPVLDDSLATLASLSWSHAELSKTEVGLPRSTCIICDETFPTHETIELSCEPEHHVYCNNCAAQLFEMATKDESLYPPRCCRNPIPLETVQKFLTPEATLNFLNKSVEFNTENRTYCCNPSCSTFIPQPDIQNNVAVCLECNTETCAFCKQESHQGEDCPQDPEIRSVVRLAGDKGWKRCTSCRRMIELSIGCFHMTCLCKNQFCYLCGARWKTCNCPQFEEDRLLDERNRQVAQEERATAARNRGFQNDPHVCGHAVGNDWTRTRHGFAGPCVFCGTNYRWLLECPDCGMRLCVRCRLNRIV
ncbi:hypothetical protein EV356DRAFT_521044 [Viridothelium virens]|uniref:RBR-type E3 ubiquitin transferase n=1 Tax=Viridothelium virens TaxID=1048519 RepID=A0A6A6GUK1_VIRVR|nr:hypothetical protein EV356DRAFT_521044 [Viridothelium virens]